MSVNLRPYQQKGKSEILNHWGTGVQNVMAVFPTGAGKTVLMASIIADEPHATCAIAHRQELVGQISMALARNEIRHRIVGTQLVVKTIVRKHMKKLGKSFYDPSSRHAVAGVDTLIRRGDQLSSWLPTVKLWVIDEAHHVVKTNKWGIAVSMFTNARGLGVTATPCRADGLGLGRHADGWFDVMVIGPTMRDLINEGFLTEYRIFAPPSSFHREDIKVSPTTGDFNLDQMRKVVAASSLVKHDEKQVVGDIVQNYLRIAPGLKGICFVTDIDTANEVAAQFNAGSIAAAALSSRNTDDEREEALDRFERGELTMLVNVDLFGEGFDLPAIEVVIMARPTESFGLYAQQFGRMLRLLDGKIHGVLIDHVGNVVRHGLPDAPREWSLDRREKRSASKSDVEPVRVCVKCTSVFEKYMDACPYCGEPIPAPAQRTAIEFVDGDLFELDAATLAQLRGEVAKVDLPVAELRAQLQAKYMPQLGILAQTKRHVERQGAVAALRDTMAHWAGYERHAGLSDSEIYRKFYIKFSVDMIGAQTMKIGEVEELNRKIVLDRPAISV
jgi:DNA repair protein RadD